MQKKLPLAVVFPGQGSQSLGMLKDIAASFSIVEQTFAQASDVLGYDVWTLIQQDPQQCLDQTAFTQPALLTASYALWRILQQSGLETPQYLAGHSLGEYTALVCAEALDFTAALKLVAMRGELMQAAVPAGTGAMAAIIGLNEAAVIKLCEDTCEPNEILAPANFNSVGQIVIAGHKASVVKAVNEAKAHGAKLATLLAVSVPSHSALMLTAAEKFADYLAKIEFATPKIAVINNIDAEPYASAETIATGLVAQLSQPVQWVKTIEYMIQHGITTIIECGPNKILTGLNKRIDKSLQLFNTADLANLRLVPHLENLGV